MFPALKKALLPALLIALFAGAASLLQTQPTRASIGGTGADDGVWFLEDYGITDAGGTPTICEDGELRLLRLFDETDPFLTVTHIDENDGILLEDDDERQLPVIQIAADDDLILCVEPQDGTLGGGNVVFTTNGPGTFSDAACGDTSGGTPNGTFAEDVDDDCIAEEGENSATLTVVGAGDGVTDNDMSVLAIRFSCNSASVQDIIIDQDDADDDITFTIMCKGEATNIALTVLPSKVESAPAIGNTSHALLQVELTDSSNGPLLPGTEVTFIVDRCAVGGGVDTLADRKIALELFEEPPVTEYLLLHAFADSVNPSGLQYTTTTLEVDTNEPEDGVPNHSEALAIFHAEGCDPGPVKLTVLVDGDDDVSAAATITVIGPVAHITIAASPTQVICGEKSEITVTATDALNQNVSEHTFIEVITNFGGVLAGTGSSLVLNQPVNPLSSATVEIVNQTARAYLLTSTEHIGPYEVLAASSPTQGFIATVDDVAPVVAQVTVTCTKAATAVTAPNTGTGTNATPGTIRPPNTGDAGLVAPSGREDASLLVIAAAVAFALTAFASLRLARR